MEFLTDLANFMTEDAIGVILFLFLLAIAPTALTLLKRLLEAWIDSLRVNARETQSFIDDLFVAHMDNAAEIASEAIVKLLGLNPDTYTIEDAFEEALEPARLRFEALMASYGWENAIRPDVVTTQVTTWLNNVLEVRFQIDLDDDGFIGHNEEEPNTVDQ